MRSLGRAWQASGTARAVSCGTCCQPCTLPAQIAASSRLLACSGCSPEGQHMLHTPALYTLITRLA